MVYMMSALPYTPITLVRLQHRGEREKEHCLIDMRRDGRKYEILACEAVAFLDVCDEGD
jgi:hypothetical protein